MKGRRGTTRGRIPRASEKTKAVLLDDSASQPSELELLLGEVLASTRRFDALAEQFERDFIDHTATSNAQNEEEEKKLTGDILLDQYGVQLNNQRVQDMLESTQRWLLQFAREANEAYSEFASRKKKPATENKKSDLKKKKQQEEDLTDEDDDEEGEEEKDEKEKEDEEQDEQEETAEEKGESTGVEEERDEEEEEEEEEEEDPETRLAKFAEPSAFSLEGSDHKFAALLKKCDDAKQKMVRQYAQCLVNERESLKRQCQEGEARSKVLDEQARSLQRQIAEADARIIKAGLGKARLRQIVETRLRPTVLQLSDFASDQTALITRLKARLRDREEDLKNLKSVQAEVAACEATAADDPLQFKLAKKMAAALLKKLEEAHLKDSDGLDAMAEEAEERCKDLSQAVFDDQRSLTRRGQELAKLKKELNDFDSTTQQEKVDAAHTARLLRVEHEAVSAQLGLLELVAKEMAREARRKVFCDLLREELQSRDQGQQQQQSKYQREKNVRDPYANPPLAPATAGTDAVVAAQLDFDSGDEEFDRQVERRREKIASNRANREASSLLAASHRGKTALAVGDVGVVDKETDDILGLDKAARLQTRLQLNAKLIASHPHTAASLDVRGPTPSPLLPPRRAGEDEGEENEDEEEVVVSGSFDVELPTHSSLTSGCYGLYSELWCVHLLNAARSIRVETTQFDAEPFLGSILQPKAAQKLKTMYNDARAGSGGAEEGEEGEGPTRFLIDLSGRYEEDTSDPATFRGHGLDGLRAFSLGEALDVMRRASSSLLDSRLVDAAQAGRVAEDMKFLRRMQRTVPASSASRRGRLESKVREACSALSKSVMVTAPRVLLVKNDRRLLADALLPLLAFVHVASTCSGQSTLLGSGSPEAAKAAEQRRLPTHSHNRAVLEQTALQVVTLVVWGAQHRDPPRPKRGRSSSPSRSRSRSPSRKNKGNRSGGSPSPPRRGRKKGPRRKRRNGDEEPRLLGATDLLKALRRLCLGIKASSSWTQPGAPAGPASALAALDVAASRFLLAAEEAEEKNFGAAASAASTTSAAAGAEAETGEGAEAEARDRGRGVPRSVEYGQSEAIRKQRLVFTAAHRHALLGFTLYLATSCSPLEPPPQARLLETFNRGVKDAEDTLLSDNGISPSSSSSSSPRALGAVVPTEDLQTLLCTVAPEAIPAVLALDLLRRVVDEELSRQRRVGAAARSAPPKRGGGGFRPSSLGADLAYLNVTLSPALESALRQAKGRYVSSLGLPTDPASLAKLPPKLAHAAWVEGLASVASQQGDRVLELAWGVDGGVGGGREIMPLPKGLRERLVDHVQVLQFLAQARLRDGLARVLALHPNLVDIVNGVFDNISHLGQLTSAWKEPLRARLAWMQAQAVALSKACAGKRLELHEARASVSLAARNMSLLRDGIECYGDPRKAHGLSREITPELRKLLQDPDDDGLGPVLVVLRSQAELLGEEKGRLMAQATKSARDLEAINTKVGVWQRKVAALAEADQTYGPTMSEMVARLLDKHAAVDIKTVDADQLAPSEQEQAAERQSKTLQAFHKGMQARTAAAKAKKRGRFGLYYTAEQENEDYGGNDAEAQSLAHASSRQAAAAAEVGGGERLLLERPMFARHYETVVTLDPTPTSASSSSSSSSSQGLALAPQLKAQQQLNSRAGREVGAGGLVPGERPRPQQGGRGDPLALAALASASLRLGGGLGLGLGLGAGGGEEADLDSLQPSSLLDPSSQLPRRLRFDTPDDRLRFERLFGISQGELDELNAALVDPPSVAGGESAAASASSFAVSAAAAAAEEQSATMRSPHAYPLPSAETDANNNSDALLGARASAMLQGALQQRLGDLLKYPQLHGPPRPEVTVQGLLAGAGRGRSRRDEGDLDAGSFLAITPSLTPVAPPVAATAKSFASPLVRSRLA